MLKNKLLLISITLILISVTFLTVSVEAENGNIKYDQFHAQFEQDLKELVDFYNIPGAAVALISGNQLTWTGHFGYADLAENRPVTAQTLFRAESITKSMTARLIMTLIETGEITLDDPVAQYLTRWEFPESSYNHEEVTIRRLLNHSAGITGGSDYLHPGAKVHPIEEVLAGEHGLHRAELVREPGSAFEYSNQGFMLLEMLVEELTDQDYESYFNQNILEPAGVDGYFSVDEQVKSRLATSYHVDGEPVPHYVDNFKGAGGLLITAEDLARLIAEGSHPELYDSNVEPTGFYGLGADISALGHFIEYHNGEKDNEKAVFHGGEGTGSLGKYYIFPERGEGIVVLTNSKASWPFLFEVLNQWTELKDLPQPEMAGLFFNIVTGLNILLALIILAALIILTKITKGLILKEKCFKLKALKNKKNLLLIISVIAIMAAWWYLGDVVVTNLLPVRYNRLGIGLGFLSLILILKACISDIKRSE